LLAEEPGAGDRRGTHAALERRLSEASRGEVRGVLAEASVLERIRVSETAINKLVAEPGAKESTRHALQPYANLLPEERRAAGDELAFLRTRPRTQAVTGVLSRIRGSVRRNGNREAEVVLIQTRFSK
jgi:hypothetical protein